MHTRRLRREVALGLGLGLSIILLLTSAVSGVVAGATSRVVAVLYPETDTPYRKIFADILSGIEQGLTTEVIRLYSLPEAPDVPALRRWMDQQSPAAVITLGRLPTETYEQLGLKTPQVIGALDASPQTRPNVAGWVSPSIRPCCSPRSSNSRPGNSGFGWCSIPLTTVG